MTGNKAESVFFYLLILLLAAVFLYFQITIESKITGLSKEINILEEMLQETKIDLDKVQKTVEKIGESMDELQDKVAGVKEVFQQAKNLQSYMLRTQPRLKPEDLVAISYALLYYAQLYNLDPLLTVALVEAESCFSPRAVSPKGAKGLMQLMPGTARMLEVSDPFDIYQNIAAGTRYLAMMVEEFGDLQLALAAYNTGPGRIRASRGIPPFSETKKFLTRVEKCYSRLEQICGHEK